MSASRPRSLRVQTPLLRRGGEAHKMYKSTCLHQPTGALSSALGLHRTGGRGRLLWVIHCSTADKRSSSVVGIRASTLVTHCSMVEGERSLGAGGIINQLLVTATGLFLCGSMATTDQSAALWRIYRSCGHRVRSSSRQDSRQAVLACATGAVGDSCRAMRCTAIYQSAVGKREPLPTDHRSRSRRPHRDRPPCRHPFGPTRRRDHM